MWQWGGQQTMSFQFNKARLWDLLRGTGDTWRFGDLEPIGFHTWLRTSSVGVSPEGRQGSDNDSSQCQLSNLINPILNKGLPVLPST